MTKVETPMIGTRAAGTALSRRIVIDIGNRLVKSNISIFLKENGRSLQMTKDWARVVLKSMNWVKRKCTTGKIESSQQFLVEEKLTFH